MRALVAMLLLVGCGDDSSRHISDGPSGCQSTAPSDGYNVYELVISNPPQNYFLNSGPSNVQIVYPLDYTEPIQVTTGATLTLSADPVDLGEVKNVDANLQPVSITGTSVPQPYDGQFIQMDVTDIESP